MKIRDGNKAAAAGVELAELEELVRQRAIPFRRSAGEVQFDLDELTTFRSELNRVTPLDKNMCLVRSHLYSPIYLVSCTINSIK